MEYVVICDFHISILSRFIQSVDFLCSYDIQPKVAVSLSGGSDSLSLVYLSKKWICKVKGFLMVFMVNHNLRLESEEEMYKTLFLLKSWGVNIKIIKMNYRDFLRIKYLQVDSRWNRFQMLIKYCYKYNINYLLLGHHLEDQSETRMMRFINSSGIFGLKGILPLNKFSGIRLLRPLISFSKTEICSILPKKTYWIEDNSNYSVSYIRNRLRGFLKYDTYVNILKISRNVPKFERLDNFVNKYLEYILKKYVYISLYGYVLVPLFIVKTIDIVILERLFSIVVHICSGNYYPPRYKIIINLIDILINVKFSGINCGGCLVIPYKGKVLFTREWNFAEKIIIGMYDTNEYISWDGRFLIKGITSIPGCSTIEPLGYQGIEELNRINLNLNSLKCPSYVERSLPCVRFKDTLVSIPHLKKFFNGGVFFNFKINFDFINK